MQIQHPAQRPMVIIRPNTTTQPVLTQPSLPSHADTADAVRFEGRFRELTKHTRNAFVGLTAASALTFLGALGLLTADQAGEPHGIHILKSQESQWGTLGVLAMGLYGIPIAGIPAAALATGERLTRKKPDQTSQEAHPVKPKGAA